MSKYIIEFVNRGARGEDISATVRQGLTALLVSPKGLDLLGGSEIWVFHNGFRKRDLIFSFQLLFGTSAKRKGLMEKETVPRRKPDPAKMQALRSLPVAVKQSLTREEADAFLYDDVWPDSLLEKLKGYMVEQDKGS